MAPAYNRNGNETTTDSLLGGSEADLLSGGAGNDTVDVDDLDDKAIGGAGTGDLLTKSLTPHAPPTGFEF